MKQYLRVFEIQPGGWLVLAVLYFFADLDEFFIVLSCVLIHEIGHLAILKLFHIPVRRITLDATGFTICYNTFLLVGLREFAVALAGPMLGLFAAAVCAGAGEILPWERLYLFAGCNAVLSLFNLLPAKPLDGWRCLHAFFPRFAQAVSVCTAITVLCIGIWVMYAGYGTALAIMGIILLLQKSDGSYRKRKAY